MDNGTISVANATPSPVGHSSDILDLYRVIVPSMITASVVAIALNLVVLASVRWVRRNLSPTLYFSLSLAVSDAYSALVVGVGLVVNSLLPVVHRTSLGQYHLCFVLSLEAFRLAGLISSAFHLLALAVNHYIGIIRPLHYAATMTRRTTALTVAAMWTFPLTFFFLYFSAVSGEGFQSTGCRQLNFLKYSLFRGTFSLMFFSPLVLMIAIYVHIFVVVRQHQKGLLQFPSSRQMHRNVKAVVTTLLILGTYLVGWMPAVMYFVLTCLDCPFPYDKIPLRERLVVGMVVNTLILAKFIANPFIYAARMPEVREALLVAVKTRCGITTWRTGHRQGSLLTRTDTFTSSIRMVSFRRDANRCVGAGSCGERHVHRGSPTVR